MKTMTILSGVALVCIVGMVHALGAQGTPTTEVLEGPPPLQAQGLEKRPVRFDVTYPGITAQASFNSVEGKIEIKWRRTGPEVSSDQVEDVAYWPTDVCGLGQNRLCVAGKTGRGRTVIEIWTFASNTAILPGAYNVATGQFYYPDVHIPIESKSVIFNEKSVGKDIVSNLFQNLGNQEQLFVQFWDSRDVYALNVVTQGLAKILSPHVEAGVGYLPALGEAYNDRWQAEHLVHGYVYFICTASNTVNEPRGLVLIDENKDGLLDQPPSQALTAAAWATMGFDSSSTYQRIY